MIAGSYISAMHTRDARREQRGAARWTRGTGRATRGALRLLILVAQVGLTAACVDKEQSEKLMKGFETGAQHPDEPPRMLNKQLPFHYPPTLFAQKVQGNVTLRLFLDRDGRVRPESTQVVESSGYTAFDSAAVRGSQELRFVPAKTRGEPQSVTILFPVYFRYPGAPPLPGDSILKKGTKE